jgi:hypothetical protein
MTTLSARQSWVLAVAIVLASLILGVSFGGRTSAQPKAEQPAPVGRYQIRGGGDNPTLVVIDTTTGQCWVAGMAQPKHWEDLGSPAQGKK